MDKALRKNALYPFSVILSLLLLTEEVKAIEIPEYYPGKDELCTSFPITKITLDVKRIISVIDYYNHGDKESFCIVIGNEKMKNEELKLSASKPSCTYIISSGKINELSFSIAKDHICNVKK